MGTKVRSIERKPVPGGVEVIARGRSNRGTPYIHNSVVVLRGELSQEAFRNALGKANEALLEE